MIIILEEEDFGYLVAHLSAQIEGLDEELTRMRGPEWNPDRVALRDSKEKLERIRMSLFEGQRAR